MRDSGVATVAAAVPQQSRGRISASTFRNLTNKLRNHGHPPATVAELQSPPEMDGLPADAIAVPHSAMPAPAIPSLAPVAGIAEVHVAAMPVWESRPLTVEGVPPVPQAPKFKLPDFAPIKTLAPVDAAAPAEPPAEELQPLPVVASDQQPELPAFPTLSESQPVTSIADLSVPEPREFEAPETFEPELEVAAVLIDEASLQTEPAWPDEGMANAGVPEFPVDQLAAPEAPDATGEAEAPAALPDPEPPQDLEQWAEPETVAGLVHQIEDIPSAAPAPLQDVAPPDAAPPHRNVVRPAALSFDSAPAASVHRTAAVAPAPPQAASPAPTPKSDRLFDAMIKTIADSVYAKPTASERAAFLRDIAALMEEEAKDHAASAFPADGTAPLAPPAASTQGTVQAAEAAVPEAVAPQADVGRVLRKKTSPDPFAKTFASIAEPKPAETADADEESGDVALSLLDMMSAGSASGLPQERALAADTLLRILPRIPVKQLLAVVERVAIMEQPPVLLVARLIRDPRPEVVAPLLERCMHITDQDLITAAREADPAKQRMMARRRVLTPVLADELIRLGDPSVVLTLIRNPGASFSHDAFYVLAEIASRHNGLLAPLATRADLPPPVAFELFWFVPPELRRFILSRFLTDSETLNKILRITLAAHGSDVEQNPSDNKFPPREILDQALDHIAHLRLDDAADVLSEHASISRETILRILADPEGEPLAVILKALGYPRSRFTEAINGLRVTEDGILRRDRDAEELQIIFDSLSFNKARILLTYWDWYVRKSGPYAPRH